MATSSYLSTFRDALRQLKGGLKLDGNELCVPCKKAAWDDDFARIGTSAWLNDGYPDCEHLDKPVLYCCLCRHILRAKEYARRKGDTPDVPNPELDWMLTGMEQAILVHDDGKDLDGEDGVELRDFEVAKCEFVRSIRDRWVDLKRVKSWLAECETGHGDTCSALRYSSSKGESDILLVDVKDQCLVKTSLEERFFALSYVWGQAKQFLTLKENIEDLLQPGGLSQRPITQTIRDAMALVSSLDERYLWVDTVCIVQDDIANKMTQINQMATIYGKAVATIIAMSGASADSGLPGIPPTERNKSSARIAPGLSITERTPLERAMNEHNYGSQDYPYNTRAWTFQERLLAKRSIVFLREQVFLQCRTIVSSEDRYGMDYSDSAVFTLEKAERWSRNNKSGKRKFGTMDDFRYYEDFVEEYTSKQMGFPSDIINAFSGIMVALGDIFSFSFREGLPREILSLALLWTPRDRVQRRPASPLFPSWSWAGWTGRVHYKDLVRPLHFSLHEVFEPLAEFEVKERPSDITTSVLRCTSKSIPLDSFTLQRCEKRLENPHYNTQVTPDVHFILDKSKRRCGILYEIQQDCVDGAVLVLLFAGKERTP